MVGISKSKNFRYEKRKKTPILVGGTGLYFKALTEGLVKIPNIPIKFRHKIRFLHKKYGSKKFFSKLIILDPLAKKFKSFDTQRVIRAYEIKLFTKKSMYEWFKNTKSKYEQKIFIKFILIFQEMNLIKQNKL